jgi:hypothetical protein
MPCLYDRNLCDTAPDEAIRVTFYHRDDVFTDIADQWLAQYGEGFYAPIITETLGLVTLTDADVDFYREIVFTDPDTALAFKTRFY